MKTLFAIVLCFCVGCGVSEQEKLAKRINDKLDCEEERAKKNEPSLEESRRQLKTGKALLKKMQAKDKRIEFEVEQEKLRLQKLQQELRDIKKKNPLLFKDEKD